jgi:hypothetical protein
MVIAHFMVGAQKKMVFGPAGWFKNARNDDVAAILSFGGASDSYAFVLSFFLSSARSCASKK